jgi:hypothetical protein
MFSFKTLDESIDEETYYLMHRIVSSSPTRFVFSENKSAPAISEPANHWPNEHADLLAMYEYPKKKQ